MSNQRRHGSQAPPGTPSDISSPPSPDVNWNDPHRHRHRRRHRRHHRRHSCGQVDRHQSPSARSLHAEILDMHPPYPPDQHRRSDDAPLITAMPRNYNPNSGLMGNGSETDTDGESGHRHGHHEDAEGDVGSESGSPLPVYDHEGWRSNWEHIPNYLREHGSPDEMPGIRVQGSGPSSSAGSAPPYVEDASEDARSSVYARSRASSFHSQHPTEDTPAGPSEPHSHHSRNRSLSNLHPHDASEAGAGSSRWYSSASVHPPPYRPRSDSYGNQPEQEPHSLGRHRHRHFGDTNGSTARRPQVSRRRAFVPVARTSRLV